MLNYSTQSQYSIQEMPVWPLHTDAEKSTRVLLVEDDRTTRRLVKSKLKGYCQLIVAPNASQGISSFNFLKPDMVFLDIELPDGNGHNLATWMLHNDPGAFVVMFSGHSDSGNLVRAARIGVKGFVTKPFDLDKMLYFIKKCPNQH